MPIAYSDIPRKGSAIRHGTASHARMVVDEESRLMVDGADVAGTSMGSPATEQALGPEVEHGDQDDQRWQAAQRRPDQIGGRGFDVADDVSCDQRSGDAAKSAEDDDGERGRGELEAAARRHAMDHGDQDAGDAGQQAIDRPYDPVDRRKVEAAQHEAAGIDRGGKQRAAGPGESDIKPQRAEKTPGD